MNQKPLFLNRSFAEWFLTLPVFTLLILTLVIGTGEMFHGQLLRMGEKIFGDPKTGVQYFMLRADPVKPDCDPNADIEAQLQQDLAAKSQPQSDVDALFADEVVDPEAMRQSLITAQQQCQEKHAQYTELSKHFTAGLKTYRAFETAFFGLFHFGTENRAVILIMMVTLAGILTTLGRHHIALRSPESILDFKLYSIKFI